MAHVCQMVPGWFVVLGFGLSCQEQLEMRLRHQHMNAQLRGIGDSQEYGEGRRSWGGVRIWPLCLTLCGLLPSKFHSPQCSNIRVAVLVQSYLLDVLRRSWKDGWPMDQTPAGKPSSSRPSPSAVLEFVDLRLPTCLPQLSSTTFSWPLDFCRDLLKFLKALRWPKKPTAEGVSWAELIVNIEIVTGKAVPTRNGAKTRAYGQDAVPLLESSDNLYTKVLTMSNACRCLARLLGKPVVVGRQARVQIAGLPGNHQFNGLDRRPLMSLETQTQQTLHDCLHTRLFAEINSASAKITACETPAQNPVKLAALGLNLLKWDVSMNGGPAEVPVVQKFLFLHLQKFVHSQVILLNLSFSNMMFLNVETDGCAVQVLRMDHGLKRCVAFVIIVMISNFHIRVLRAANVEKPPAMKSR